MEPSLDAVDFGQVLPCCHVTAEFSPAVDDLRCDTSWGPKSLGNSALQPRGEMPIIHKTIGDTNTSCRIYVL